MDSTKYMILCQFELNLESYARHHLNHAFPQTNSCVCGVYVVCVHVCVHTCVCMCRGCVHVCICVQVCV